MCVLCHGSLLLPVLDDGRGGIDDGTTSGKGQRQSYSLQVRLTPCQIAEDGQISVLNSCNLLLLPTKPWHLIVCAGAAKEGSEAAMMAFDWCV